MVRVAILGPKRICVIVQVGPPDRRRPRVGEVPADCSRRGRPGPMPANSLSKRPGRPPGRTRPATRKRRSGATPADSGRRGCARRSTWATVVRLRRGVLIQSRALWLRVSRRIRLQEVRSQVLIRLVQRNVPHPRNLAGDAPSRRMSLGGHPLRRAATRASEFGRLGSARPRMRTVLFVRAPHTGQKSQCDETHPTTKRSTGFRCNKHLRFLSAAVPAPIPNCSLPISRKQEERNAVGTTITSSYAPQSSAYSDAPPAQSTVTRPAARRRCSRSRRPAWPLRG
jgi:hypothetical protein